MVSATVPDPSPSAASVAGAPVDVSARTVVVAGGRGYLGSRLVDALVGAGASVVVPFRARPDREPPTDGETLRYVALEDWRVPDRLVEVLGREGWRPDAAVVAVGGWWLGPRLLDLDLAEWDGLLASHLTSHLLAARALLPLLGGPDPVYVTLGGAAAQEPMVGSGPVSVTGAAQSMLLDVLRAELAGTPGTPRLHELRVLAAVAGDDRNVDPVETVTTGQVAAALLDVLSAPSSDHLIAVAPTVSA